MVMLAVLGRRRQCPSCGSKELVLTTGGLVCSRCGLVVDDTVFMLDAPRAGDEEPAGRRRGASVVSVTRAVSRVARSAGTRGMVLAPVLSRELVAMIKASPDMAVGLASNECMKRLLHRRRKRPREVAAAVHVALSIERYGVPPLPSVISTLYSIPRSRARKIIGSVKACLENGDTL